MSTPTSRTTSDSGLIPPAEMLFDGTSSVEQFVEFGDGFVQRILVERANLAPSASFLDVGCGNGSVARPLTKFLSGAGRYLGLDVRKDGIAWLQQRYRTYEHFQFIHTDVFNKVYNPTGVATAREYRFPCPDTSMDMVLLKSVFTHMVPADLRAYLREIARVLRPGGRSVITYFLLNEDSRRAIELGLDAHKLTFDFEGDPLCRVSDPARPEAAVGHDERRVLEYYGEAGCRVLEVEYGNWCGRPSALGHQDLIIAERS